MIKVQNKNIFTYRRLVYMEDTDSTGNLYFTAPLRFSVQAFEHFLHGNKLPEIALPIVHSEQDIFAPAKRGEEVTVYLYLLKLGKSSFTIETELYTDVLMAKNQIVHVALPEITGELRALLLTLKREESVGNLKTRK